MYKPQLQIRATFMRGGTSKGVFFSYDDLPQKAKEDQECLDKLLLRVLGSPDPYKNQIDGLGGTTSSTSKSVIVSKSSKEDHDIDYLFGQVSVDKPFVDWSGNCGNLSGAVGSFAISRGLIPKEKLEKDGIVKIKIWQKNIKKTLINHVRVENGVVKEMGDFFLDGVAFSAEEIKLEFVSPIDKDEKLFPTGNLIDDLEVPNVGSFKATMISAGIPTIFLKADELGFSGTELRDDINQNKEILEKMEVIRAHGALKMGLIKDINEAKTRAHTPKIAFVSPPKSYTSSSGKSIKASDIDLNVRAFSMGQIHHAMMGTASVAISVASCIKGTLLYEARGGGEKDEIIFGHPSGVLKVGASIGSEDGNIVVKKASMSRSARIIMDGFVHIPADTMD